MKVQTIKCDGSFCECEVEMIEITPADLKSLGWLLGDEDLCPSCVAQKVMSSNDKTHRHTPIR